MSLDEVEVGETVQVTFNVEEGPNNLALTGDVVDVADDGKVTVEFAEDHLPRYWPGGCSNEVQLKDWDGVMARLHDTEKEMWIQIEKFDELEGVTDVSL